jgi:PAS domain S-box-containing protein
MSDNEFEALETVDRFLDLKINRQEELQEIVQLASELCKTPIALITLMKKNIQYLKFKVGTAIRQLASEETFCQYFKDEDKVSVVPDALKDSRFSNNMLVLESQVRFYAGIPLRTHDGLYLGSLCVAGTKPRDLSSSQKHLLKVLAKRVVQIMEFGLSLEILKKQFLQAKNSEIKLRSFFESAGTCHLLIGKELEVIAFNKNMAYFIDELFHVKVFAGQSITDILQGGMLETFISEYHKALKGNSVIYERKVTLKGDTMWWSITLEPGYNVEGEIIGISYNATDITEKKIHEQQILDQNECLMQIAHIQSHELRKPVASILGFVELFKANNYTSDPEELMMLGKAATELDEKIRAIVALTE